MFAGLLPGDVVVEETDGRDGEGALEEELALVADAATSRREEFAAGRACARRALQRLGVESGPLLVGENREPLWPEGVVGSPATPPVAV